MEQMMLQIIATLVNKLCAEGGHEEEPDDDERGKALLGAYAQRVVRPWPS